MGHRDKRITEEHYNSARSQRPSDPSLALIIHCGFIAEVPNERRNFRPLVDRPHVSDELVLQVLKTIAKMLAWETGSTHGAFQKFSPATHSNAAIRDSAKHSARCPNKNGLMGTLWERAQCADAQLLIFQEEMARQSE
jgi:hypothetical protein